MEKLYTIPEVAAAARIGQTTLYRHFADGTGPVTIRVGKRRLVPESALRAWLLP